MVTEQSIAPMLASRLTPREAFTQYLEDKGLRKTVERYAILDEIYAHDTHFEVEDLVARMKVGNYSISRATIYNTVNLLIESNLVVKTQVNDATTKYEKSYGYIQHDHIYCQDCQKLVEFCDPRIGRIQSTVGELLHFSINRHSLIFYGSCLKADCANRATI